VTYFFGLLLLVVGTWRDETNTLLSAIGLLVSSACLTLVQIRDKTR
jgi:hypothetical protein